MTPADSVSGAERGQRTRRLLQEAHDAADEARRHELLEEVILLNRGVAEAIAHRYRGRGVPVEDLRQAAYEGLVRAVHKFDPTVSGDLLTYAVPTIRGEVQRWFRDQGWMVRPPRRLQELQWRINRSIDHLSQDLGRPPTDGEVRADLDCSERDLAAALEAYGCFRLPSLDRPVKDTAGETLGDLLADDANACETVDARVTLAPVVRRLSDRDRRILYLRYFEDHSQKDIGVELGVSQMQVSRLLERILRDLRLEIV
jgi:RNA polymerase sigma-B factor